MLLPSSRQCVAILHPPPCTVSAYVTHGVFPNKSWQRFKPDLGGEFENGAASVVVLGMHRKPWLWMAESSISWAVKGLLMTSLLVTMAEGSRFKPTRPHLAS